MHFAFIPYGRKNSVDLMLRDMEAQKFPLPMTSPDGKTKRVQYIESQLRILPFGIMEYVFPKEQLDLVLKTLRLDEASNYEISEKYLMLLRKVLNLKKIPKKFNTKNSLLWITQDVNIIPLGFREDAIHIEESGVNKDFSHEAI